MGSLPVFSAKECRRIMRRVRAEAIPPADWQKGNAVSSRLFFELATRRPILDRVAVLLGDDVMLWAAAVAQRVPGRVHPWHTDIETSGAAGKTVSVWIGLEHTNQRSSLLLVPYSHRFGVTLQGVAVEKGRRRGEANDEDVAAWAREYDPRSGLAQLHIGNGDALLFDGKLWHGSRNTNRWGERTALLLQYATPETPIRMPDLTVLEWPFRFLEVPRPACIMVRGTTRHSVNRLTPGPPPEHGSQPALSSWIKPLELPLEQDEQTGWKTHHIFRGATRHMTHLSCHASVLSPGKTPHEPHDHPEEEILVMLSGEADLVIVDTEPAAAKRAHKLRPGSFVYYPAYQRHTIRSQGPQPATYLMFKWRADEAGNESTLETSLFDFEEGAFSDASTGAKGFAPKRILEGGTRYLRKLRCHFTTLQPGAGYPPHVDGYDVAILLLSGTVETLGQRVDPPSVVFYATGEPHGMENVGSTPATYLVFEFHPGGSDVLAEESHALQRLLKRSRHFASRILRNFPQLRRLLGRQKLT